MRRIHLALLARSIVGIMVAHSIYDLTAFPDELGHPGIAALLHWLFVLFCLVVSVRALRRARRRSKDPDLAPSAGPHYLYFPDEPHARTAAQVIGAAGWDVREVRRVAGAGRQWIVAVEQGSHGENELDPRAFLEGVAATNGPGQYRGRGDTT